MSDAVTPTPAPDQPPNLPPEEPNRRRFLGGALTLGCSAAAFPLVTPVTVAAAPGENRLVVIILRGAMDGLDVVRPRGEAALAGLRPTILQQADAIDLDGFFGLHPRLDGLAPLWSRGELAFAHAVATPYRDKRSHFDGQDFLENGGEEPDGSLTRARDGWLNRMLTLVPGAEAETAYAVGRERMLLLDGEAATQSWSPDADLALSPQGRHLLEVIYRGDPLFAAAAATALNLSEQMDASATLRSRRQAEALATFAADRLSGDARIAAFSIGGWDTHRRQDNAIVRALEELQTALLTLRDGLGPHWSRTMVLAITEFGRTVRENGSAGTDHGTGGALLMAGGAIAGARVHGRWPGLADGDLYNQRDLMPTDDVRRYAGWALRGLFGLSGTDIERTVFPGLDMGSDLGIVA
ncbi:MAG: DUF1501 domain-containing protein [Pseudomonadota bacterium]